MQFSVRVIVRRHGRQPLNLSLYMASENGLGASDCWPHNVQPLIFRPNLSTPSAVLEPTDFEPFSLRFRWDSIFASLVCFLSTRLGMATAMDARYDWFGTGATALQQRIYEPKLSSATASGHTCNATTQLRADDTYDAKTMYKADGDCKHTCDTTTGYARNQNVRPH